MPITTLIKITALKLLPKRILMAAGKTMIAEINNAPAIGIIMAIATPVKTLKSIDITRTGKPSTWAVSSSKVKMYMGRLNKKNKAKTTKNKKPKIQTCSCVIVTIDPNKYDWILVAEFPPLRFIKTRANAKPPDIKMAIEISE